MKNCYCPRCGGKQKYKVDDPCNIIQLCPGCGMSLLIKMRDGEMLVRARAAASGKAKKTG